MLLATRAVVLLTITQLLFFGESRQAVMHADGFHFLLSCSLYTWVVHIHPLLRSLVPQVQCSWIPINGQVQRAEVEVRIITVDWAATTKFVPRTPGTHESIFVNSLQRERVFVSKAIITVLCMVGHSRLGWWQWRD
uniref:Putative secreted protein ovary overexpressed n=1 Tax=Rhipicephalus microplus TaxID=6941 RepID=A0A6M2DBK1_RHIMP